MTPIAYTPFKSGPPWLAPAGGVPVTSPENGSMESQAGAPAASENVNASPSGSLKAAKVGIETLPPSVVAEGGTAKALNGASFWPVTVSVSVACAVPPLPSETV